VEEMLFHQDCFYIPEMTGHTACFWTLCSSAWNMLAASWLKGYAEISAAAVVAACAFLFSGTSHIGGQNF
jgi:hypothetical protein